MKKKQSFRRPSDLELKLQKVIKLIHIVSLFAEKSHRRPSDVETRNAHRCLNRKIRSHLDLSDTNQT